MTAREFDIRTILSIVTARKLATNIEIQAEIEILAEFLTGEQISNVDTDLIYVVSKFLLIKQFPELKKIKTNGSLNESWSIEYISNLIKGQIDIFGEKITVNKPLLWGKDNS